MDIHSWMTLLVEKLRAAFGERIVFVGLQGSYGRGEATAHSDIDAVVIFDRLAFADVKRYGALLDEMPCRALCCGFIAGWDELLAWEPSDLFQLYFDTKPVYGSLKALEPLFTPEAVERAIRIGACNLYHGCVHHTLHGHDPETLRGLYKSAAFTVQALHYRRTGVYVSSQRALLEQVNGEEKRVLETSLALRDGAEIEAESMSAQLFAWTQQILHSL